MDEVSGVETLDDILHDLEGSRKLEDRLGDEAGPESCLVIARGVVEGPPGIGRQLLAGSAESTLRRYATLLRFEPSLGPSDDFAYLIGPASQVLEAELGRVLFEPARPLAPALISAVLGNPKSGGRASILEKWAEARVPTTIGIGSLLLMALRRGCGARSDVVLDFLDSRFVPGYQGLLMSNGLGRGLDVIRERFRNPACHGSASFDEPSYREFARLAVACRSFALWDASGPDTPAPAPESGVLHHHLSCLRRGAQAGTAPEDALARLIALAGAASSIGVRVGLRTGPATPPPRDIRPGAMPAADRLRLGDRITIEFEVDEPCHVALIDFGTSGGMAVLWPNAWHRDTRAEGGRPYSIPGEETRGFDFILTGRPGLERIAAIATPRPLGVPLAPEGDSPFRALTPGALEEVTAELRRLGDWTIATCEFRVEE